MNPEQEFKRLLDTTARLMGPGGCPWDQEQTTASMRGSILEEAYEVLEAIEDGDDQALCEELGDLFYNVVFFCTLAEKEKRFSLGDAIAHLTDKLIYRHPHVFGEKKLESTDEVIEQWDKIKKEKRESLLDGIPKAMPALARAMKVATRIKRAKYPEKCPDVFPINSDEELGKLLWDIVVAAREHGLHPEEALRKEIFKHEGDVRAWEKGG